MKFNAHFKPKSQTQNGFTALGIVMMIFICTLILLTQLEKINHPILHAKIGQIKQFENENLALSALAFGERQNWNPPTFAWQCIRYSLINQAVNQTKQTVQTCLKLADYKAQYNEDLDANVRFVVLKGEAENTQRFKLGLLDETGKIYFKTAHWLDICPNLKGKNCD